jgi:hypothetical protein
MSRPSGPFDIPGWPVLANNKPHTPELFYYWQEFIGECWDLHANVRGDACTLINGKVLVHAEVERLGSYGPVYWHGYSRYIDGYPPDSPDDTNDDNMSDTSNSSENSDHGQDKIGWFLVQGSISDETNCPEIKIHTGIKPDNSPPCSEVVLTYRGEHDLRTILSQPGPGSLAYTWNHWDNPFFTGSSWA